MTARGEEPGAAGGETVRVSTLELFFDLVFVFTITQLTSVLVHHPSLRGLYQVVLMLSVIWWMYAGYVWLTNGVSLDVGGHRLTLISGMAGFLVLALAIPGAFSGSGTAFGLAYLAVVLIHAGLFTRTLSRGVARAILGLAPFNIVSALLVLAAGVIGGTPEYVLWTAAAVLEWSTPWLRPPSGFEIAPGHFVERHGLVVIVALGESVVAVGIGASGRPIGLELVGVAVLGLLLAACMWWAYFGGDDARAEEALSALPAVPRALLAVRAFGHWHLPILLGIVATAAGLKTATAHAFDELHRAQALQLGGGVALFLAGDIGFRRALGIGESGRRTAALLLAVLTIPLGLVLPAMVQLAALVAILAATLVVDHDR